MGRSQPLDTGGHLWVEEGERRETLVAEVAPTTITSRTYSFSVPDGLVGSLTIGQRVQVPLGRGERLVQGFVLDLSHRSWDTTLRAIHSVVDAESFLTPELIALGREISAHYACPLGRALKAITPEAVRKQRGLATIRYATRVRSNDPAETPARRMSEKRRALLDRLDKESQPMQVPRLLAEAGASAAVLRGLVGLGLVEITERKELPADVLPPSRRSEPGYELNAEQTAALEVVERAIDAGGFSVILMHGVSGSGKTEVYLRAMRRVLAAGGQAILLVPEIVLTTQLVQRLATRFDEVAIHHSGLTDSHRSILWRRVAAGERRIVIGTRSAVFAPCPNLGLICVDEEQEGSYKNLQAPRFHVRDVAIMRARQLNIPVLLGSATPSIETFYHSEHRSDYRRVVLRHRVRGLPLPKVHLVDMRDEGDVQKGAVVLSRLMERLLRECLQRGEQAMLLMNRRGFATRIFCSACRSRIECPNCSVGLVVHRAMERAICHYCRARVILPTTCPDVSCRGRIVQFGLGTQRVEEVLAARFPGVRLARVDSDTMKHRDDYRRIVDAFEAREIDLLIGTQMIAKGLDFPFVSFVGVIQADGAGLSSDFRAQERLFQLVTQVAGRAGRADTPGCVVVQSMAPELSALQFALSHDYEAFVEQELAVRERIGLPPFRRLARLVVADQRDERAKAGALDLASRIRAVIEAGEYAQADVLGPNPCSTARRRGRYRHDLLVRAWNAAQLRKLLAQLADQGALRTKAQSTIIDVDPVDLD